MGKIISFEVLGTIPIDGGGPGTTGRITSGRHEKYEIERVNSATIRMRPRIPNAGRPHNWTVMPWSNFLAIVEEPDDIAASKAK
jgi:hypothetical protein